MDSLTRAEAEAILSEPHYCEDASPDDWVLLERPKGAFSFELGLLNSKGENAGLVVAIHFFRQPTTRLITIKMTVFKQHRKQLPVRVYQLQITAKSYCPDDWHDEAHEHFGDGRDPVPQWREWRSFPDILKFFSHRTNIQFRPPLEDPEYLRLKP
ncbi:hypothetical protein QRO11_07755 [Paracidovorax citrulli]|uniref:Uncharacterized protein n=1 Tax=Paracidovorax citrulli TaxID=80869 RepID=A0ABY9AUJ9_PARCI|nr:hypothetical protein [Paracidovorax citrulli]PVY66789.1 hypothetical protein C8E08_4211 [Paracidovorax citrulli]QCX09304.1 hypothetical protein APS58_0344 [Paracidovorax citrulli]REG69047.1 hypothetical protein C8E07_2180 [Paracidovorax citrulli]RLJ93602.1 hypothetical protein C8E06_2180 [Paracidovorax citrulli]UEG47707.1 hypothetical protein LKW27_07545 [Paracidovorax citrulli]